MDKDKFREYINEKYMEHILDWREEILTCEEVVEESLKLANEVITKLERLLRENKRKKIITAIKPFIFAASVCCVVCLLDHSFIPAIIPYTIITAAGTVIIDVFVFLKMKDGEDAKGIYGVRKELKRAYELREEYEQRLSKIKEKAQAPVTVNLVETQNPTQYDVLTEQEYFWDEVLGAFQAGYDQKDNKSQGKKRVLKK